MLTGSAGDTNAVWWSSSARDHRSGTTLATRRRQHIKHSTRNDPISSVSTERHSSLVIRMVSLDVRSPPGLLLRLIEPTIAWVDRRATVQSSVTIPFVSGRRSPGPWLLIRRRSGRVGRSMERMSTLPVDINAAAMVHKSRLGVLKMANTLDSVFACMADIRNGLVCSPLLDCS